MITENLTRRKFLATASTGAVAAVASGTLPAYAGRSRKSGKLAIKGGKAVRTKPFQSWPIWDKSAEKDIIAILRSGDWFRGRGETVTKFENAYAELLGAKRCVCTVNGTNSLLTALHVLDVGVGDEVIVSPYTFIATYNVVIGSAALPVFADTDPETFQIDPDKIEERITERTRAILPVHILGIPANMDKIMAIAKKHNLVVIEDACQGWLGEWRGKKLGTIGDLGCFSFQNSKHLPCGEGGAVVGNDDELMDRVWSYHNCGRPYRSVKKTSNYPIIGTNRRMMEYQAAVVPDFQNQRHTRHCCSQTVRRRNQMCISSVPVPIQEGAVQRRSQTEIPRRPQRRRHPLLGRIRAAVQRRIDRGRPEVQELHKELLEGQAEQIPPGTRLSGQRPALPGSSVALPDPAARRQKGHGRHCQRNSESRREQRSISIAENVASILKSILRALEPLDQFQGTLSNHLN
ncbi:MAG: DegT/DnrJ/EryC1/StrS family aminotransferase [Planctomycetota bacterium]|jgi:hypothetical protein